MDQIKEKRCLVSSDGFNFREATLDEIKQFELESELEIKKREDALKIELDPEDIEKLNNLRRLFEERIKEDELAYEYLEELKEKYPYRDFGRCELGESIGYLQDTVSRLKDRLKEK